MCETIFKLSYMLFFVVFASSTPDKHPFFEISEMTTHPTMTTTFESAMLSFSPGVNSRAELVTLAPGLRPERRFAPLARGQLNTLAKVLLHLR